jgi:alkylation response protein AidB-like acyl-CoA dehydrogenase
LNDYFAPTMRLYVEKLVDWGTLLRRKTGEPPEVESEVGAYRGVLETTAALAASFERPARENWHLEAQLTEDGGAEPPAHIRKAYDALREAGLITLSVSEAHGGPGLPAMINGFFLEMLARADASLMTIIGLQTGAASDIECYGNEAIKAAYLPRFTSGDVQGAMDLTEPQAGSDLGGITTRVDENGDGTLRVEGTKIFITNGGAEVHLVLARDADTYEESKGTTGGLSLVLVPRHLDDGTRNAVRVSRLEEKLGIHGSPTCEVVFEGATGFLLGEKGRGFRAMLELMNNARLGVAAQGLGVAAAAFHAATTYANHREQFGQPIAKQPLVLSMLAKMAINIEGARALLYRTFELLDHNRAREAVLARGAASEEEAQALRGELERDTARVRLLTPLCKYYATEVCDDITRDAMQVFGGIGYTMDADVAKLHADGLILTVYEGTSEIQASFALREMGKGALALVNRQVREELGAMQDETRRPMARRVEAAIAEIEECVGVLFGDIGYALLRAKLFAEMVINVIAATELLRQVAADPARVDVAQAFVTRRMLETENMARRIQENSEGRVERDGRVLASLSGGS